MARKKPARHGRDWTKTDLKRLRSMAGQNVDTDDIASRLQRTKAAIYSKASDESISLKPKDK
jgi:hypothetical protein